LGIFFFFILQKLAFCKIIRYVCFFFFFFFFVFFFLYVHVIIFAQHLLPRQALHQYNISCIVVSQWQELHWWHHFKVKGQGYIMVKVGCQLNSYILSSLNQTNSKLGVKVAYELPLSWLVLRSNHKWPSWLAPGSKVVYPEVKFWNCKNHIVQYLKWKPLMSTFQINKRFDAMTSFDDAMT
jgi:hypothetical protein